MVAKGRGKAARGEDNPKAKLTAEQVHEIRAAKGTLKEIAHRYGIHFSQVSNIKRGNQWRHL